MYKLSIQIYLKRVYFGVRQIFMGVKVGQVEESPTKFQSHPLGDSFSKIMLNFNLLRISFFFGNVRSLRLAKFRNHRRARPTWAPDQANQANRQK